VAETLRVNQDGERRFFAAMAVLFVATALIGFGPNSVAILNGTKTNPPLIIHLHAAAMASWLALLLAQAALIANGNRRLHRKLGMVSVVLAPIMVAIMFVLAFPLPEGREHVNAIAAIQVKRVTLFSLFFAWAFLSRKSDTAAHRRLMFLATLVVLDAAFNRMKFLPTFGYENLIAVRHAWELVLLVPIATYDIVTTGRLHRVNAIGIPLIIAFSIVASLLW
jgi:uncharacterized membrane protein YozB (DUF420 family)